MEHFITAVTHLEDLNPGLSPLALVTSLHKIADNVTHDFVGSSDNQGDIHYENNSFFTEQMNINHNLSNFLDRVTHHFITDDHEERGVVLTPDGTTVALAPLLLGLEYGLRANEATNQPHGFYLLPLAKYLGMSFMQFRKQLHPSDLARMVVGTMYLHPWFLLFQACHPWPLMLWSMVEWMEPYLGSIFLLLTALK